MSVRVSRVGDVAIATIENPPVNAVSAAVRAGLMYALREAEADLSTRAVVLMAAGRTFVAGADIREFGQPPTEPLLPDVIAAIESASKPWIAAMHGTALGGGLELAMGCHFRIGHYQARFGLPEVTLGLIPGAGGTVRLPRLVDPSLALQMIAGGKPISAEVACDAGLLDEVAKGDLLEFALAFANRTASPRPTLSLPVKPVGDTEKFEKQVHRLRKRARGQSSIAVAINAVLRSVTNSSDDALSGERADFVALKESAQSKALRHIFFAERGTLKDPRVEVDPRAIRKIGIIGGGTMGAGIAAACLMHGFDVAMIEVDQAGLTAGTERVASILAGAEQRGVIPDAGDVMQRFQGAIDYAVLSDADLVIEAVFEDLHLKIDVLRQIEASAKDTAILATNTSYLDVNVMAAKLRDPSRLIGLHFFSPAHVMKLLEIVVPDAVSDDIVATAAKIAKSLGKNGVLSGVCDGFIGNRIMSAYRREADNLLLDGATPQAVDKAMRNYGFPMGVFEMQDLAGLDIAWAMRQRRAKDQPAASDYVKVADRLCEMQRFGRKAGAGWYDYDGAQARHSDLVDELIARERAEHGISGREISAIEIMNRILDAMQREATAVLEEGIARSAEDIDVVMVNGYGFPRWRGGPMFAAGANT